LQVLSEFTGLSEDVCNAIKHEATYNIRQMATIAGKLVTADGRSSLVTAFLALDATVIIQKQGVDAKGVKVGDWLPFREQLYQKGLITMINIPTNVKFAYEYIARTPADLPIVCAALAQWNSGRTRLALGGWGSAPILAMDGPDSDGLEIAGRNAYSIAEDQWASAEYRQEMAGVLSQRCLDNINRGE
jgi:CO/xanthine dehydrogenase FAD-binding subunit